MSIPIFTHVVFFFMRAVPGGASFFSSPLGILAAAGSVYERAGCMSL